MEQGGRLMEYVRFFLGTPRRLIWTLAVLGVVWAAIDPTWVARGVAGLLTALMPVVELALVGGIMLFGLRTMVSGLTGSPKKRK
jgi:hypothetical protein